MLQNFIFLWNADPIAVALGPIKISWYGLTWSLSILCSYFIVSKIFEKENKPEEKAFNLVVFIFFLALIGARLGQILFYDFAYYMQRPLEMIKIWEGGLASHGAMFACLLGIWFYVKKNKEFAFWWILDLVAIVMPLCGGFIRIGNFMNSELFGKVTALPWGVYFQQIDRVEIYRHPTQLYESIWLFLCFGLFILLYRKNLKFQGMFAALFFIIPLTGRLLLEFTKDSSSYWYFLGMSKTQWLSIPLILLGIFLFFYHKNRSIS